MRLFLNSRGQRVHDYAWHEITPDGDVSLNDAPEDWLAAPYSPRGSRHLVSLETETYVIARRGAHLVLVVAGLRSTARVDFAARYVEDCLLLSAGESEEAMVRHLAALALNARGALVERLDAAVRFDDDAGFSVDASELQALWTCDDLAFGDADLRVRTAPFSERTKADLARELQLRRLPQRQGLLVLASPVVTEAALIQGGVWRGIWGAELHEMPRQRTFDPFERGLAALSGAARSLRRAAEVASGALPPATPPAEAPEDDHAWNTDERWKP